MSCERTSVELEVLERIKPTRAQERILKAFYAFLERKLSECLKARGFKVLVEAEGSYAKGTLLSDKWEIDVFILFEEVTPEWVKEDSLRVLEECVKPLPYIVKYAEHPYLTINIMGLEAEIIPALKADKPQLDLGVGRTPFHTRYVKSKLEEKPCLADDVRLLKSFMEGIGVYGAETGIGGFSGYLAELLVIHYGGFLETLRAATHWKPQIYIDLEGVGDERRLRDKYSDSPLIVVDPVDPERNAAASVTREKLSLFILASTLYLLRPSREYFHIYPKRVQVDALGPTVLIKCTGDYTGKPKESILGKLRRASHLLSSILREWGFRVTWSSYASNHVDKVAIAVGLESLELPELEYRRGPSPWDGVDRALSFLIKRFEEGGVVWVSSDGFLEGVRRRRYTKASQLLSEVALPRIVDLVDAITCEVIECSDGVECIKRSGLKWDYYIGGPPVWMKLAYTLLKHG